MKRDSMQGDSRRLNGERRLAVWRPSAHSARMCCRLCGRTALSLIQFLLVLLIRFVRADCEPCGFANSAAAHSKQQCGTLWQASKMMQRERETNPSKFSIYWRSVGRVCVCVCVPKKCFRKMFPTHTHAAVR